MELSSSAAAGGESGGTGGAGPAPFLLKTYEMIDDPATDKIVSWNSNKSSFVVWNPPEFARLLLPTYFKHNNFSSFIRQLNTYGFRKIDPEQWEFANVDFMKDKKHLLKNIHRRKPIHSHSQPQGSQPDPERVALDEEIERLAHEKSAIQENILKFRRHNSAEKLQLENLAQRIGGMEQKQSELIAFLEGIANNPNYIQRLAQKIESMDLAAYSKRRRQLDSNLPVSDSMDNHSISRPDFVNMFHQDHSNKLNLELSSAVSDINFVSRSTQSSSDDGGSSQRNISEGAPRDAAMRTEGLVFTPETLELTDTGTSFTFNMESPLLQKIPASECPGPNSIEEGDGHMSSLLNLTLAFSTLQENKGDRSTRIPQHDREVDKSQESRSEANGKEVPGFTGKNFTSSSSRRPPTSKEEAPVAPAPANDGFWEHFLTERPGVDTEEASDNQEERNSTHGTANIRSLNRLTL